MSDDDAARSSGDRDGTDGPGSLGDVLADGDGGAAVEGESTPGVAEASLADDEDDDADIGGQRAARVLGDEGPDEPDSLDTDREAVREEVLADVREALLEHEAFDSFEVLSPLLDAEGDRESAIYFVDDAISSGPLVADFTVTMSGLTAGFTDKSSGIIQSQSWEFGDGDTSQDKNPSHTYASDGIYPVSLTVTDPEGNTNTVSRQVTVSSSTSNAVPSADFSYTDASGNDKYDLDGRASSDSDGTIATWEWDTDNDGFYNDETGDTVSGVKITSGTVGLRVTDDDGSTATVSKPVP